MQEQVLDLPSLVPEHQVLILEVEDEVDEPDCQSSSRQSDDPGDISERDHTVGSVGDEPVGRSPSPIVEASESEETATIDKTKKVEIDLKRPLPGEKSAEEKVGPQVDDLVPSEV